MRRWYGKTRWDPIVVSENSEATYISVPRVHSWADTVQFCIKESRHGKGCFLHQDRIAALQPLGVYPGVIRNQKQVGMKLAQLPLEKQAQVMRYLAVFCSCYLDPTNSQGGIDKSFRSNPMLYLNEPDADQQLNVVKVWNEDEERIELWSAKEIRQGEELFICYGASYNRDYDTTFRGRGEEYTFKSGRLVKNASREL